MKIVKNMLLSASLCAGLSLTAWAATPFTDLGEVSWAESYVQTAFDAGCVSGVTDTTFHPTGNLTMAEFSVMITKAWYGTELAEEMSKHQAGQWGDDYINTLKNQCAHTYGSTISQIASYESLSRYEASYIIGMMLVDKGIADESGIDRQNVQNFTDVSLETTEETLLAITMEHNIMSGKAETSFDGTGTLTRAEACVIISKLIGLEKSGLERDDFDENNVTEKPVETPEPEVVAPSTTTGTIGQGQIGVTMEDELAALDRLQNGISHANTVTGGNWH